MEQENQIVENQLHRSVPLDHEMGVDGVVLRERMELIILEDRTEIHRTLRWINSNKVEVTEIFKNGETIEELIETSFAPGLNFEFLKEFNEEFENKYSPY